MHTPRVVIWTTSDPESARASLLRHSARPRLLVPVPHGTFVLGPDPYTSETLIDTLRIVKGVRVGLVWTETTAWLVYFDGAVRGWRFGPDDSFEPATPKRIPDGLSWLTDAAAAVRAQGVIDGLSALRIALESAGFYTDAAALVRIDGGEVDEAVPHHEKKWWESVAGERQWMSDLPVVNPALPLAGTVVMGLALVFLLSGPGIPALLSVPVYVLLAGALAMQSAVNAVFWQRGQRVDPFPERDILGMSDWARAAEEE